MAPKRIFTTAGRVTALAFLGLLPVAAGGQAVPPADPAAGDVELTLPQARQLAVGALAAGQAGLAYQVAQGLLQADPASSFAHFVLANAQGQLGQPAEARRSAARAYRYADTRLHRFEAAELAARLSYAEGRPTLTQLWLRRAVQNAPDKQVETQLGRDFGRVRAENPFSFSLRGGLRPSNNVNGGADTAVQIIDGLPFVGTLSGDAQALGGVIGHVDAILSYRLRGDERSRTDVGARLYVQRVALNSDARALAPGAENGDFGSTYAEVGIDHSFAIGDGGGGADVGFALGQYWSGGTTNYAFARVDLGRDWNIGTATRLSLNGTFELRQSDRTALFDTQVRGVAAQLRHRLEGGDRISVGLSLRDTNGDFVNARTSAATFSANYAFGKQMGPAKVSAGLVMGYADYPDFVALFAVPGGRQDRSVYADVNFFFPDADYAGFAPTLRVRAGRKFSNVSRYDTRELSVSLGIQSKF